MGVYHPPPGSRPHPARQYPFLANEVWVDLRERHSRWPWFFIALMCGIVLAAIVTDWENLPFLKSKQDRHEGRVSSPAPSIQQKQHDLDAKESASKGDNETGPILQIDRNGSIPRLPGSTPDLAKHFLPLGLEQQIPKASASDLTLQSGMVRLPPLSILKIYFPKPYKEAPSVKLSCETVMPSEVSIDEVTEKVVVIRNAHMTNDCYFRYYAEGKLKEETPAKP